MHRAYHAVLHVSVWVLVVAVLAHALVSFEMMRAAGEVKLSQPIDFIYWYATTAYTVGYGDLSPQTDLGKMATALFVFPGAIAAFTTIVAKVLGGVAEIWRLRRTGRGNFSRMTQSIILIGFDPERTPRMIDELHADPLHQHRLVLVTRKTLENPDPRVRYVQAQSLTSADDLRRAGVPNAHRIAIYADSDEQTLAAALAVAALNKSAHVVCYFSHPESAELLGHHCPNMECIVASGAELVARSIRDPGASYVLSSLISHLDQSATLFSLEWPQGATTTYGAVTSRLLGQRATVIAAQTGRSREPLFHPGLDAVIESGDRIYYVAEQRVPVSAMGAG